MAVGKVKQWTEQEMCVCDRCKRQTPYNSKRLGSALQLIDVQKWSPVSNIKDAWLCPVCVAVIINEWYQAHHPMMFEDPLLKVPSVIDSPQIAKMIEEEAELFKNVNSYLEQADSEEDDDIPF